MNTPKRRIILHIGAPKCASSTLQTFLSENPEIKSRNSPSTTYKYFAITMAGTIVSGETIKKMAKTSPLGYCSSVPFAEMKSGFGASIKAILKATDKDVVPILSSEGWGNNASADFLKTELGNLDVYFDIFFVVRPPILWVNSSWWQWGVWTNSNIEEWVNKQVGVANFINHINKWKASPFTNEVILAELKENPLKKFTSYLEVDSDWSKSSNVGSSPALLEFLVRNKKYYGRLMHKPGIEFTLNRLLGESKEKLPFVITTELQKLIFDKTRESNEQLANYFKSETQRQTFLNDPEYFDPDHFSTYEVKTPRNYVSQRDRNLFTRRLVDKLLSSDNPDV